MFKTNVKITYAESWLPIHHKFFIHAVEFLSARIALEKRYKNFISNSRNKTGTKLWKHALFREDLLLNVAYDLEKHYPKIKPVLPSF